MRAAALLAIAWSAQVLGQACPRWERDIGQDGIAGQVNACLLVHDDGHGRSLFAGGSFVEADGHVCFGIARWDGVNWAPVRDGVNGVVYALAEYDDDGGGLELYVAGDFTKAGDALALRIARWDGELWSALGKPGDGLGAGPVRALLAFGGALYAGGDFTTAAGTHTLHFAKWDGSTWSDVDGGFPQFEAMAVYDDGSGPHVWVHGTRANQNGLHKLVNGAWEFVTTNNPSNPHALLAWDPGDGQRLYVGSETGLYAWNGQWQAVTPTPDHWGGRISALAIHDDGSGAALYAGGVFDQWDGGGPVSQQIARWDGHNWSGVGGGVTGPGVGVDALASAPWGEDSALFVGGEFLRAGCNGDPMFDARHIAEWTCRAGCYADSDRSGALDLFDFLSFVNDFNAPSAKADCDQNCSLDLFDFLCFTNTFNAGC